MRIVQVCAVDFTAYYFLGPLMRACRDDGWEVDLACADGPFASRLRAEGIHHRPLPISRSVSPARNVTAAVIFAASLRSRPADLVHTHTPMGGLVGRSGAVLAGARPLVHTFHGLPFADRPRTPVERAFLVLERLVAQRTDRFFSQAAGDASRAVALGIARAEVMTVIGNGVDVRRFRPDPAERAVVRRELGVEDSDVVVVAVARMVREKGLLELADAAERLATRARVHVLLVGAALPSDRTSVEAILDAHPVTRRSDLRWRRIGHSEQVDRLLRAADVFVLPSYREGLPRSVIEALASGLPVIATDIPACRELVDPSVGRLVRVADSDTLRAALEELVDDPDLRAEMGRHARERALERYDERAIVAAQLPILRSLVA